MQQPTNLRRSEMQIFTVITKPTKFCNADCTYCSAPPDGSRKWSLDEFKHFFDKLAPHLGHGASIIWHGGEPMLMGPDFYIKAHEYKQSIRPDVRFAMQSNILLYERDVWRDIMRDIFYWSVSTSFDPDQQNRTLKGSTEAYTKRFHEKLDLFTGDGGRPMVIGTYTQLTWPFAMKMYEQSLAMGERAVPLRFNYRYPAGRDAGMGEMITPETYGRMLIELYDRWIKDVPAFGITPLDQMLRKVIGTETERCPWTAACGGRFLGVEPNGDTFNCSEFADLADPQYRFGNIFRQTVPEMLASKSAVMIRRRRVDNPPDCRSCRHWSVCQGGCARDSVLYERGLGGKFYYCQSWKMVFDRIKESVRTGEAAGVIQRHGGYDPKQGIIPAVDPLSLSIDQSLAAQSV